MLIPLGGGATQADEVLADHPRRDRRKLHALPLAPCQESPHSPLISGVGVRIVMFRVEEFVPGEACSPACPLDQHRQIQADARSDYAVRFCFD